MAYRGVGAMEYSVGPALQVQDQNKPKPPMPAWKVIPAIGAWAAERENAKAEKAKAEADYYLHATRFLEGNGQYGDAGRAAAYAREVERLQDNSVDAAAK